MSRRLMLVAALAASVAACSDPEFDASRQIGPNPDLPAPRSFLFPPMGISPGIGWPAGATPTGSAVSAIEDVGGIAGAEAGAAASDRVLAYAGQYDDRDARAELVAGAWGSVPSGGGELEAAVPEAAASAVEAAREALDAEASG